MARQIVIGLGYKKGSGKNTFAKFLGTHIRCSCNHLKVQEVSFAHKVKDLAFQLYGWAGIQRPIYYETHYSDKEITLPQLGKSPRQIWIEIGNKMREIYQNTWIDYALNGVKGDIIIITDMGFLNEAKAILFKHGYLIKIQRSIRIQKSIITQRHFICGYLF